MDWVWEDGCISHDSVEWCEGIVCDSEVKGTNWEVAVIRTCVDAS